MAAMRILVTGAAGFIGRYTLDHLRLRQIEYVATDCRPNPEVPGVVLGDLLDENFTSHLLRDQQVDAIIHLAGMLPTAARRDPMAATRANVDASCILMRQAQTANVGRVVFGSSLGVYGGRFGSQVVTEETPAAPEEIYGAGKLLVEYVGSSMQSEHFAFSALRIATTLGEGVTNSASPWRSLILEALGAEQETTVEVPYVDDAILPMVHVKDVARALVDMASCQTPVRGIFNSPVESLSIAELRSGLARLNPNVRIKAGARKETGIPAHMTGAKLASAVGYEAIPLRQHFEDAAKKRTTSTLRT
jgi:nucleoside-diphosphate-sugar epimerase